LFHSSLFDKYFFDFQHSSVDCTLFNSQLLVFLTSQIGANECTFTIPNNDKWVISTHWINSASPSLEFGSSSSSSDCAPLITKNRLQEENGGVVSFFPPHSLPDAVDVDWRVVADVCLGVDV